MPASSYFRNAMLKLFLQGSTIDDIAENDTTSPSASLYLALHTADPGLGGTQASSEASYGGYARVAVTRSGAGFTITGNTANLNSLAVFPACTDGTVQTMTHFSIGPNAAGATPIMFYGTITPNLPVSSGFPAPALKADTVLTSL